MRTGERDVRECICDLCTTSAVVRRHNPPHGKASTYRRYGCRCAECTSAATTAQRATRARHTTLESGDPS